MLYRKACRKVGLNRLTSAPVDVYLNGRLGKNLLILKGN
jgi:hypothetical protein